VEHRVLFEDPDAPEPKDIREILDEMMKGFGSPVSLTGKS